MKDHDTAKEIVQDAFVRLWQKRGKIEEDRSPASYLATTVRNRCLNHLRNNKKFDRGILMFEGLGHDHEYVEQDHLVTEELRNRITQATDALPGKCREVFLMNRVEHKKYQEIADELGISLKTVEAQMSKALRIMRDKLSEFLSLIILLMEILNIM